MNAAPVISWIYGRVRSAGREPGGPVRTALGQDPQGPSVLQSWSSQRITTGAGTSLIAASELCGPGTKLIIGFCFWTMSCFWYLEVM